MGFEKKFMGTYSEHVQNVIIYSAKNTLFSVNMEEFGLRLHAVYRIAVMVASKKCKQMVT